MCVDIHVFLMLAFWQDLFKTMIAEVQSQMDKMLVKQSRSSKFDAALVSGVNAIAAKTSLRLEFIWTLNGYKYKNEFSAP